MADDDEFITEADFKALVREAHDLGLHYTGSDAAELHGYVTMARAERGREHPVPCYGLSFDATDRRCRICQLRNPCADLDHRPRVEVIEASLQALPCDACGKGMLEVELVERETKEIRDYGCTTRGCQNSVKVQCGWEDSGDIVREIVLHDHKAKVVAPAEDDDPPDEDPVAVPQDPPKPALRAIEGGKAKKKVVVKRGLKKATTAKQAAAAKKPPTKKVVVKRAEKPEPKPAPTKKAAPKKTTKKKAAKKSPSNGQQMAFTALGQTYSSLTALVNDITAGRNWSPKKFFSHIDTAAVQVGDAFSRDWHGTSVDVEVIKK